jgi:hypothetical protein
MALVFEGVFQNSLAVLNAWALTALNGIMLLRLTGTSLVS